MKKQHVNIFVLLLIAGLFTSCNSVKRVPKNEHLLTKNELFINDKKEKSEFLNNLLYQKPNTRLPLIGTPLRLYIYNTARPNIDSILQAKIYDKPVKVAHKISVLSKKQLNKEIESRKNFNTWIKTTGEAPVIINDSLTEKSLKRLEAYYWSKGWFNVISESKTERNDNKKGSIAYKVTTGKPYIINSTSTKIASPVIDSIYQMGKVNSFIKKGEQFDYASLVAEKDRITYQMRNNGIYHFSQDNFYFENDTIGKMKTVNVETQISNRLIREEGDSTRRAPFKVYKIKDVNIFTNNTFDNRTKAITDSVTYEGFNLYSKGELKYNPKTITDAIFITPNNVFKDRDRPNTSRRISNLKTFKYPDIKYVENPDTTLTANITLTPLKKFSLSFGTEISQSNIQTVGFSFNPGLVARNVFRGAETLEISGLASIGASKDGANDSDTFFDINEIGANLKLTIPRLFSPFNTEKLIPKSMFPSTRISLAATSQNNIGLDKQTFTGIFNYQWYPNKRVTNRLDLFNVQFVKNLNTANYFNVYGTSFDNLNAIAISSGYINSGESLNIPAQADQFLVDATSGSLGNALTDDQFQTVNSINERKDRLIEDNLILSTNFNYVKDKRDNLFDNDFSIFRARLELAGNVFSTTSRLIGLEKNNNGRYELFNVAFSQYVKTELDYIKYWSLGGKNVLAFRSFFGIAIPYGNSSNIPFSKSFFAGGANDNRAWTAYGLGPGRLETNNEFNEANLKIALSAEQRFNLFGALNGALFVDAGNIWNALDDVNQDEATFTGFKSLQDIAVGSGFGLRYDFDFFVIRGDVGFKTYNPSYQLGNRWFNDYNFAKAVYNIGINYPF